MSGPFDLVALIYPRAGKADRVEELLRATAVQVKAKEPGTLRYHLHRETKGDAPSFVVLETYKDQASLGAHAKTDHFKEMGKAFKEEDLIAEPMKIYFTKEVGGYASKL